jgi:hypothetical protein
MAIEEITSSRLEELKQMPKRVTNPTARTKREEKHERTDYQVTAHEGQSKFCIYLRQSVTDLEDFSCGIRWVMPSGENLTLARYNGSSHIHGEIRYECHVHQSTEEAIRQGRKPESPAKQADCYHTLQGALPLG